MGVHNDGVLRSRQEVILYVILHVEQLVTAVLLHSSIDFRIFFFLSGLRSLLPGLSELPLETRHLVAQLIFCFPFFSLCYVFLFSSCIKNCIYEKLFFISSFKFCFVPTRFKLFSSKVQFTPFFILEVELRQTLVQFWQLRPQI